MTAANQTITIEQGEYFSLSFTYETGSPPVPVVMAGWEGLLELWDVNGSVLSVTEVASGDGQVIISQVSAPGGASPNITMVLSPTGTIQLTSSGTYQLTVWDSAVMDKPVRLMRGLYKVHTGATP